MWVKVYKQWDNYERDRRIKNIEYLVKLARVYVNDVYNFITIEEDKKT